MKELPGIREPSQGLPTIDPDALPRDVRRRWAQQESDAASNVRRIAQSPKRNLAEKPSTGVVIFGQR